MIAIVTSQVFDKKIQDIFSEGCTCKAVIHFFTFTDMLGSILGTLSTNQFNVYSNFTTQKDKSDLNKHLSGNQFVTLKYYRDKLYSQLPPDAGYMYIWL